MNCVINPATGRAVKADSRLGKKLMEAKQKAEPKKPTEPKEPAPTNKRPRAKPKKKEDNVAQYSQMVGNLKEAGKLIKAEQKAKAKDKTAKDIIKMMDKHLDDFSKEGYKKALNTKPKNVFEGDFAVTFSKQHKKEVLNIDDIIDGYGKAKFNKELDANDKKIYAKYKKLAPQFLDVLIIRGEYI